MSEEKRIEKRCEDCLHYCACILNSEYVPSPCRAYKNKADVVEVKPFMEDGVYPLTITSDRYSGAYSGGEYIAWNLDADEVPQEIYFDDVDCYVFWKRNKIICGKGRTVSEALTDLYTKLKEAGEKDDEGSWDECLL